MNILRCYRRFSTSQHFIDLEHKYGCHNYHPLPVVIAKAKGIYVWDQEGKKYMDFMAAYSAVNQGHCHPKIFEEFIRQASNVTLTSRAFHNNQLGLAEKCLATLFKYDKVLFMNTGVEAGDSAIKFARRWAYNVKGVPDNQARVIFPKGNFWGRSIAACGSSDDPDRFRGFGPFGGLNFDLVEYNNLTALEEMMKSSPNYAAYYFEPIQGEMGVLVPQEGYLRKVRELCNKYKVLMIADEIQTGLGRTGKLLACDHEGVRPDMVVLGKSLSGGFYPISVVLADDEIMLQIKPGEHGSTYGGNPLASALAIKAVEVMREEGMIENAAKMGVKLSAGLEELRKYPVIKEVRSRGLMGAIEFKKSTSKDIAWEFCTKLAERGIITKPTHGTIVRISPPLIITEEQVNEAVEIFKKTVSEI